jgi:hypothetical protein
VMGEPTEMDKLSSKPNLYSVQKKIWRVVRSKKHLWSTEKCTVKAELVRHTFLPRASFPQCDGIPNHPLPHISLNILLLSFH